MAELLNHNICLKCCKEALGERVSKDWFGQQWGSYTRLFNASWKEGLCWCEKKGGWVNFKDDGDKTEHGVFKGMIRDSFIERCPYLMEHLVSRV